MPRRPRSAQCCVLPAGTGTEGLEVYVSADPPVKLVLLDVTLPDMSGHEVRQEGCEVKKVRGAVGGGAGGSAA